MSDDEYGGGGRDDYEYVHTLIATVDATDLTQTQPQ